MCLSSKACVHTCLDCIKVKILPKKTSGTLIHKYLWDFPGDTVGKNLPANAGDRGSIAGLRRFHMLQGNQACVPQVLRLSTLESMLHNKRSHYNEKPEHWNKE